MALQQNEQQELATTNQAAEGAGNQDPSSEIPLIPTGRTQPQPHAGFQLPPHDGWITLYVVAVGGCLLASFLSDNIATYHDVKQEPSAGFQQLSFLFKALQFVVADLIENTLYVGGFLLLAVAYRVIALRVWILRDELLLLPTLYATAGDSPLLFFSNTNNRTERLIHIMARHRRAYESAFEVAEHVSDRTSAVALLMVALVVIEMVSNLEEIFGDDEAFEFDILHLAILRLLIVLTVLLLVLSTASADVMWASERYAETMAQLEGQIRSQLAENSIDNINSNRYGTTTSISQSMRSDDRHFKQLELLASLLKTMGYRIKSFPVRISVGWFHLTPEWAMGVSLLAITTLLAVTGIKLPGGE
eukprot:scaffold1057_cov154-Amphora_coffeaeformis.AAC.3